MPSKSSRWIAASVSLLLIVLPIVLGIFSGLLTGHPGFAKFFNDRPWFNILLFIIGVSLAIVLLSAWQQGRSKDQPATREDLEAAMRKVLEASYDRARSEGQIPAQGEQAKDAEITRLTQELQKLQKAVSERSSEPAEAELEKLLKANDLVGALRLKSEQVEHSTGNAARDLFELGTIHELRFEWPQALAAFREAWELGHQPEHGFKYAHFAQKLNHFSEAIAAYEALVQVYKDPPDRARALNNLGELYRITQRMEEAEQVYAEALITYRKLDKVSPGNYLPYVAGTLDNLGILYRDTQRFEEAQRSFHEALSTYRKLAEASPAAYLPDLAMALNNIANFLSETQRIKEAEQAYAESLDLRRTLAQANPDAYLHDVATTLNNLANLYLATNRIENAERACIEALAIRRKLAKANPDAHLYEVAMTLNNLGRLWSETERTGEAKEAYAEALAICRKLAETNPDAWLPYVALTLSNQANLSLSTGLLEEAQTLATEAETVLDGLWRKNPEVHGNQMARVLGTLARIAEAGQQPAACALARRALATAYDPTLKEQIQGDIDRFCAEPPG